ncbi:MAG: glutathione synthase [Alphaproteobacteria bacterium RIFCSPLOWO2_01_FULL_40_26]|nr:MAG: glutathione synthase [Alphaproteobacteria bacterium RIFCSPHIGHO2_02_FULL_40_34]OFW94022.1 MAG: glutathione synthase [Alphaproteobacteria bacterium RIFCSPLOWO2_01_FULL_40_26]OFX09557.1 MAG: glutathione synthase [Alphaproteobacteria bacterium RIFCSPLOWO2_02_FULL_40_19]OFX12013.1 MAG: glutathione synthase [Alphaproteobacteria bacterium RIFCSPLOWO2_12_FULL_40_11]
MKLVAQMDELSSINIESDSTFAILLAAQNRGYEIFYYLPRELNFDFAARKVFAPLKKIRLKKEKKNHFEILETKERDLTEMDVVLVRQDPPFDMNYITSTYILEKIRNQVLIINDPSEIRNCPEKIFVSEFADLTPPTLITSEIKKVMEFRKTHGKIILKPLYGCGGEGVILLEENDPNLASVFELMTKAYQTSLIAQKFLPEVRFGDKRIILIDGKFAGGVARVPQSDNVRANLHTGGVAQKMQLSQREKEICERIGPEIKKRGLFFVGIDVIGDYLTEINVTSPTCIPQINQLDSVRLEEVVLDGIEDWL